MKKQDSFLLVFSKCWDNEVCQSPNMIPIVQYCPNQVPRDFCCLGKIIIKFIIIIKLNNKFINIDKLIIISLDENQTAL